MDLNEKYPGNKKKVQKVVTKTVGRMKKSTGKKFMETIFADDFKTVKNYVVQEVLIPSAKALISDTFHSTIDALFNGGKISQKGSRGSGNTFVNYSSFSQPTTLDQKYAGNRMNRARHVFDDIIYGSRAEAEKVLAHLVDLIIDYGEATIGDLYDLSNISSSHVDRAYGWFDLSSANVRPVRGGYLLQLPKAIALR